MKRPITTLFTTGAALILCHATPSQAQFIPVLTFEIDEAIETTPFGGGNSSGGLDGAGYGVTEGSQAFVITDMTATGGEFFLATTVNGTRTDEGLNNFNAFLQAYDAIAAGTEVFFTFDFGYDASGLTDPNPGDGTPESGAGYFQPGVALNSDQGYSEQRWGNLLQGNIGEDFPLLNANAAANGATLTILDPIDFAGGDPRGLARIMIPVGTAGNAKLLNVGPGGDEIIDFFYIGLHAQGGWSGTIDVSFDRVGFFVVPEPASLALLSLGGLALLRRRR